MSNKEIINSVQLKELKGDEEDDDKLTVTSYFGFFLTVDQLGELRKY